MFSVDSAADKNIVYYNLNNEYWKGSPYVKLEATKTGLRKPQTRKSEVNEA